MFIACEVDVGCLEDILEESPEEDAVLVQHLFGTFHTVAHVRMVLLTFVPETDIREPLNVALRGNGLYFQMFAAKTLFLFQPVPRLHSPTEDDTMTWSHHYQPKRINCEVSREVPCDHVYVPFFGNPWCKKS